MQVVQVVFFSDVKLCWVLDERSTVAAASPPPATNAATGTSASTPLRSVFRTTRVLPSGCALRGALLRKAVWDTCHAPQLVDKLLHRQRAVLGDRLQRLQQKVGHTVHHRQPNGVVVDVRVRIFTWTMNIAALHLLHTPVLLLAIVMTSGAVTPVNRLDAWHVSTMNSRRP